MSDARLTRHEAVLDRELSAPNMSEPHPVVAFSAPHVLATRVEIPFSHWVDMRYPNQIKVIIEPVTRRATFGPGNQPV